MGRLIGPVVAMRAHLVVLAGQPRYGRGSGPGHLAIAGKRPPWPPVETPASVVAQVAKNVGRDHFRGERRRAELDAEIGDLPEKTRRIFLMNHIGNVPPRALEHLARLRDDMTIPRRATPRIWEGWRAGHSAGLGRVRWRRPGSWGQASGIWGQLPPVQTAARRRHSWPERRAAKPGAFPA